MAEGLLTPASDVRDYRVMFCLQLVAGFLETEIVLAR